MKIKKCTKCGKELPATTKYFFESKINKVGLRSVCKKCMTLKSKEYKKERNKNLEILYGSINRGNLYKQCSKCGNKFPATDKYFFRDSTGRYCLRTKCKKCFIEESSTLKRTEKYKIKARESGKKHYEENKELYAVRWQKYYKENREYLLKKSKEYKEKNRDKTRIRDRKYREIPQNRLNDNFSRLIRQSLLEGKYNKHWETLVDYKLKDLITHLEKQFKVDMYWDNYGKWHIDHIIPISLWQFESYDDKEFKQCWALCNLQPLWADENMKKRNKVA